MINLIVWALIFGGAWMIGGTAGIGGCLILMALVIAYNSASS